MQSSANDSCVFVCTYVCVGVCAVAPTHEAQHGVRTNLKLRFAEGQRFSVALCAVAQQQSWHIYMSAIVFVVLANAGASTAPNLDRHAMRAASNN